MYRLIILLRSHPGRCRPTTIGERTVLSDSFGESIPHSTQTSHLTVIYKPIPGIWPSLHRVVVECGRSCKASLGRLPYDKLPDPTSIDNRVGLSVSTRALAEAIRHEKNSAAQERQSRLHRTRIYFRGGPHSWPTGLSKPATCSQHESQTACLSAEPESCAGKFRQPHRSHVRSFHKKETRGRYKPTFIVAPGRSIRCKLGWR